MKKIIHFIKSEAVMLISMLFAFLSMFFVTPNLEYINYVDYRTLILLFCLMLIMAGFNELGLFKIFAENLIKRVKTVKGLVTVLVLINFFASMIITNDVSLITFVPLTIVTLKLAGRKNKLIYTVTLETVAANLGSMLTPIGNPQNLYLFSNYNMSIAEFVLTIFPYALLAFVMLIIFSMLSGSEKLVSEYSETEQKFNKKQFFLLILLFAVALTGVFRLMNCCVVLAIILISVLIFNRKLILKVDYSLLLTFLFLFIFIGNLGEISSVHQLLSKVVIGNEVITGIAVSQIFSNVPAVILLSEFTQNAKALLIGVNLGGLGTLIASMASLISFKFISEEKIGTARYLLVFTIVNIIFLIAGLLLFYLLGV